MKPSDLNTKRKGREPTVREEGMEFGVPLDIEKTASSPTAVSAPAAASSDHDYTSSGLPPDSTPDTPVKPKEKKQKAEMSLSELQNNILDAINTRADNLEGLINKNTLSIEGLKKSLDFAFAEVETLKVEMKEVKTANEKYDQKISELQHKLNEAERYGRRWNLRLHGVPEGNPEDIKAKVTNICCAVIPSSQEKITGDIDMAYRLGKKTGATDRPRTTFIRFTSISTRDLLWRAAKRSEYLRNNKLRFAEDLTSEDKALRNKLWPIIEAAKKEGKKAHFAGIRVIIEGKEVRPENFHQSQMDTSSAEASST